MAANVVKNGGSARQNREVEVRDTRTGEEITLPASIPTDDDIVTGARI